VHKILYFLLIMLSKINGGLREYYIPYESSPAYVNLLKIQIKDYTDILLETQFKEITEKQAEEKTTQCVQ